MSTVIFTVGNTYTRIPKQRADVDRTGQYKKIHDWTLYCDVLSGDPDTIKNVTFDMKHATFTPSKFVCHNPVRNSRGLWRFSTRQKTYGGVSPEITLRGSGGAIKTVNWTVVLENGGGTAPEETFRELAPGPLRPVKISDENNFGVEFEMTSAGRDTKDLVARNIRRAASHSRVRAFEDYGEARRYKDGWKIMPDSSLQCSRTQPDCNRFELVSPVLRGGGGLGEMNAVLRGLGAVRSVTVNKSAGCHVHIDVESLSLLELKKVCMSFVKYEDAMDCIMPPSRRTPCQGIENEYCKSNKLIVGESNRERINVIDEVETLEELCDTMNPNDDRYYKLNLLNLKTGRQNTIEFRQHSATIEYEKVSNWVRFCMSMVINAARLRPPGPFGEATSLDDQFEMMFEYCIKDRFVRDYYRKRKRELAQRGGERRRRNEDMSGVNALGNAHCCGGCANGDTCSSSV